MDPGRPLTQQSMPVLEPDVLGAAGPSTPQTVTNISLGSEREYGVTIFFIYKH